MFAALHALAKTIDGSGFDTCSIEKDIHIGSSVEFMVAKHASEDRILHHNQPSNDGDAI